MRHSARLYERMQSRFYRKVALPKCSKHSIKMRSKAGVVFMSMTQWFSSNGEQVTLVATFGLKLTGILFASGLLLIVSAPLQRQSVMVNIIRLLALCGQIGISC